ncbi:MAG: hypothetical protein PHP35_01435 [Candidatus Colwellbacteria bacterium]|nr:hypothetical protein [Candidatus Colwellbacteria bacterium]
MSNIATKNIDKKTAVVIIVSTLVVVLTAVAFFLFWKTPAMPLISAIDEGKIEINSQADKARYFTFVSADEANRLLAESGENGEFRFLMPQFDIPSTGTMNIVLRNETVPVEGVDATFLLISGLPKGTTVYTSSGNYAEGDFAFQNGKRLFAWIKERNFEDELDMLVSTLYMPAVMSQQFMSPIESDFFNDMPLMSPILKIETEETLPENLFPASSQIAFLLADDEDFSLASLRNVLTKDGRIVMVK